MLLQLDQPCSSRAGSLETRSLKPPTWKSNHPQHFTLVPTPGTFFSPAVSSHASGTKTIHQRLKWTPSNRCSYHDPAITVQLVAKILSSHGFLLGCGHAKWQLVEDIVPSVARASKIAFRCFWNLHPTPLHLIHSQLANGASPPSVGWTDLFPGCEPRAKTPRASSCLSQIEGPLSARQKDDQCMHFINAWIL